MKRRISLNMIIETEKVENKTVFIASSPDINVFVEAKTIEEVREKFVEAVKIHLKTFPEEREMLINTQKECEMPLLTKVFL